MWAVLDGLIDAAANGSIAATLAQGTLATGTAMAVCPPYSCNVPVAFIRSLLSDPVARERINNSHHELPPRFPLELSVAREARARKLDASWARERLPPTA